VPEIESAIKRNRRKASLFKTLSGWAAVPCVLSIVGIMIITSSAPKQPDELHVHPHPLRGGVSYFTDLQEQMSFIAMCVVVGTFAIVVGLTFVYAWFKRREAQESQKQLLIDEFGPRG
jgi:hypothetical protein